MATYYRVVSVAEYENILATGMLRAARNTVEGKHLWGQAEDALRFRDKMIVLGWESECIIVRVTVPDAAAERFVDLGLVDEIGRAWFAELADLGGAIVEPVSL